MSDDGQDAKGRVLQRSEYESCEMRGQSLQMGAERKPGVLEQEEQEQVTGKGLAGPARVGRARPGGQGRNRHAGCPCP